MWSIQGERAARHEFSLRGGNYSVLPALSMDGILHLDVLENAITSDNFRSFVRGLLNHMNKWPLPNSVLVIDDASIHKAARIRELVEECGARLLYLPPYSPDFNPVELAFPTIKEWLDANSDHIDREFESESGTAYDVLREAVHAITAEQTKGWFKNCGYLPDE